MVSCSSIFCFSSIVAKIQELTRELLTAENFNKTQKNHELRKISCSMFIFNFVIMRKVLLLTLSYELAQSFAMRKKIKISSENPEKHQQKKKLLRCASHVSMHGMIIVAKFFNISSIISRVNFMLANDDISWI